MNINLNSQVEKLSSIIHTSGNKGEIYLLNVDDEKERYFKLSGIEKEIFLLLQDGEKISFKQILKNLNAQFDFEGKPLDKFVKDYLSLLCERNTIEITN